MRHLTGKIATVGCLVIGTLAMTPSAQAADGYGCPGSLIGTYPVMNGGAKYGEVRVYYSSANSGTNCSVTVDTKFAGAAKPMQVNIDRCEESTDNNRCHTQTTRQDEGRYRYFAGPVTVTGTNGHCIKAEGQIYNPSNPDAYGYGGVIGHCG